MEKHILSVEEHQADYYILPLEKGALKLTRETLNAHSGNRYPKRFILIRKRTISYQNEILTLGIA